MRTQNEKIKFRKSYKTFCKIYFKEDVKRQKMREQKGRQKNAMYISPHVQHICIFVLQHYVIKSTM